MRLKTIKLAGFKSFVDATTIPFPGNLTAIVGPNGCGKSNVIDAVRWVMGESSARYLRGESLTDVIFNGSTQRKPVGQATIELTFDNSDGSLGGEYHQYAEIAVKRQINREGESVYYLNGTRCRRRDITDIFLGTGLGPRSYAIIEQGTISRLIEAKPEELRTYVEEAAGISKYKERRRETELRIQHTRDNLTRLDDIREELSKQLQQLQRQAQVAERYKKLKHQERILKAQLHVIKEQHIRQQLEQQQIIIQRLTNELLELTNQQTKYEAEATLQQEQAYEAREQADELQRHCYQVNLAITELEQKLLHHQQRKQHLSEELSRVRLAEEEAARLYQIDQSQIAQLTANIEILMPELESATELNEEASAVRQQAQQRMREWQIRSNDLTQKINNATQQARISQANIQQIEQRIRLLDQQRQSFTLNHAQLNLSDLVSLCEELEQQLLMAEEQKAQLNEQMTDLTGILQAQREKHKQYTKDEELARKALQELQQQALSLKALQQAALNQNDKQRYSQLATIGLEHAPKLASHISVEPGWEYAVELALEKYLPAIGVENLAQLASELAKTDIPQFVAIQTATNREEYKLNPDSLYSKVKSKWPLHSLLNNIYTAETLDEALERLPQLAAEESIITPDGIWLSQHCLHYKQGESVQSGVLVRERELNVLQDSIAQHEERLSLIEQQLAESQEQLEALQYQKEQVQLQLNQAHSTYANAQTKFQVQQAKLQQAEQQQQQLAKDIQNHQLQIEQAQQELIETREIWQEALSQSEILNEQQSQLVGEQEGCQQLLMNAEQAVKLHQQRSHELSLKIQVYRSQLSGLEQNCQRAAKQLADLQDRQIQLQQQLAELEGPNTYSDEELQQLLSQKAILEQGAQEARQHSQAIEQALRELETIRNQNEQSLNECRNQLEKHRVDAQALQVRADTLNEQIAELSVALGVSDLTLPENTDEILWQENLNKTIQQIERLGAVNLAAIEEYTQQAERKSHLDEQHADLTEALEALEQAIRKIDRETRSRFKETYEQVNQHFQNLFPRIFGGGQAYLELTGEDLLETGVVVMARPPGKRNSTIHLLSGGEKALTAIALVFAIFQLNPAPFCMLDEVDAPLDDANIVRLCNLLKSESKQNQFIYISHSKVALEAADHLLGVTMSEPGVSRLVAVDLAEAVAMAG